MSSEFYSSPFPFLILLPFSGVVRSVRSIRSGLISSGLVWSSLVIRGRPGIIWGLINSFRDPVDEVEWDGMDGYHRSMVFYKPIGANKL